MWHAFTWRISIDTELHILNVQFHLQETWLRDSKDPKGAWEIVSTCLNQQQAETYGK